LYQNDEAYRDKSKKIIPIVLQEELPPEHPKRIWEEMLKKDAENAKVLSVHQGLTD
jgi:5'-deoxynucleotidase YfbR-like HD superfamily hydrolase